MKAAEGRWMGVIAQLPCCVGQKTGDQCEGDVQVHHVAEGSGLRSAFSTVPLCVKHHDPHRTGSGFHGMGTERFCKLFRVPGETEYGLLIWTNEILERVLYTHGRKAA